ECTGRGDGVEGRTAASGYRCGGAAAAPDPAHAAADRCVGGGYACGGGAGMSGNKGQGGSRSQGGNRNRNRGGASRKQPGRPPNPSAGAPRGAVGTAPAARLGTPPKMPKNGLRIVALGGIGEIGRNMTVFEYRGRLLIVDCGVLFPEDAQPGVDLILPDFSYIEDRADDIEAIILTHGH